MTSARPIRTRLRPPQSLSPREVPYIGGRHRPHTQDYRDPSLADSSPLFASGSIYKRNEWLSSRKHSGARPGVPGRSPVCVLASVTSGSARWNTSCPLGAPCFTIDRGLFGQPCGEFANTKQANIPQTTCISSKSACIVTKRLRMPSIVPLIFRQQSSKRGEPR